MIVQRMRLAAAYDWFRTELSYAVRLITGRCKYRSIPL